MFSLFREKRSRHRAGRLRNEMRLTLEALETRWCPSSPPTLTLQATVLPNHQVQLSGSVTDSNASGVAIAFSGAVQASTTTGSDGDYSYITSNASLGNVTAVATDQNNLSSAPVTATIVVTPPSVTASVTCSSNSKSVTVSGQVSDIDQGSLTVTISGIVNGTVATSSNGSYTFTAQASGLGNVSASTSDEWGQASNTATAAASCPAPTISNFSAVQSSPGYWTFTGQVNAPNPGNLTVVLGGVASGHSCTTAANGSFSITLQLTIITAGEATAQTTDIWGQQSNVAYCWCSNVYGSDN